MKNKSISKIKSKLETLAYLHEMLSSFSQTVSFEGSVEGTDLPVVQPFN